MISFRQKGSFDKTRNFLNCSCNTIKKSYLEQCGEEGVAALSSATPRDTGTTANSWYYKIAEDSKSVSIQFFNSNIQNGVSIAVIIQYGHGTKNGRWVEGRDYINPAIRPIFDKLSDKVWTEVIKK